MAEARFNNLRKSTNENEITESDMEVARQLIQLSHEDKITRKRNRTLEEDLKVVQQGIISTKAISNHKIKSHPKNQRKYRSLLNIYNATKESKP